MLCAFAKLPMWVSEAKEIRISSTQTAENNNEHNGRLAPRTAQITANAFKVLKSQTGAPQALPKWKFWWLTV